MKALLFAVCLLLSLPNLIAGAACVILGRITATRGLFQLLFNLLEAFCFQIQWGLPIAGLVIVLLLIFGILSDTRPYSAMVAFVLNIVALAIFLWYVGLPTDPGQIVVFLPVIMALLGFGWLACQIFAPKSDLLGPA